MGIVADGMSSFAGMGDPAKSKLASATYVDAFLSDVNLRAMYRTSWSARKTVDIPAYDSTRAWRNWQAERTEITAIERLEKKLNIRGLVLEALTTARLYGGAALYLHTADSERPELPLEPERASKDWLRHVTLLPRSQVSSKETVTDPLSPYYGQSEFFQVGSVTVHASRLVIFKGAERADLEAGQDPRPWQGDSVLLSALDAIKIADSAGLNIADLLFEAKVDVLRLPGLMDLLETSDGEQLLHKRFRAVSQLKSNLGFVIMQGGREEDSDSYDQKTFSFGGIPDTWMAALQHVAAAADIPAARFLGQTPAGLSATGESDIRNYYDRISSSQSLIIGPAMAHLDELIIRSALGARPDDVYFDWAPLWQISARELADIGLVNAQAAETYVRSGLVPVVALSKATVNQAIEAGTHPGLDGYIAEEKSEFEKLLESAEAEAPNDDREEQPEAQSE